MKKYFLTPILLLCFCTTNSIPLIYKYEGINDNKLRIYIKKELSLLPQNITNKQQLKQAILKIAKRRAFLLLDNYIIQEHPHLKEKAGTYNKLRIILKNGKIFYYRIDSDNFLFESYIDYDLQNFFPGTKNK